MTKKETTQHDRHESPTELTIAALSLVPLKLNLGLFLWANWLDVNFNSTQFRKKYLNPSSNAKVMTVLLRRVRVTVLEDGI
jgi:hypothetical protein